MNHRFPTIHSMIRPFVLLSVFLVTARMAPAAAITGRDFSIGLGFTTQEDTFFLNGPVTWNDRETSAKNTSSTLAPFSFSPTVTGALFAGRGPGFTNRVLKDGTLELGNIDNKVGFLGGDFQVAIEASFNQSVPGNVNRDNPNYRLEFEIINISIHAAAFEGTPAPDWTTPPTLQWMETTPGYEGPIGAPAELNMIHDLPTDYQSAANYVRVEADPVNVFRPIASPNESFTRTFSLLSSEQLLDQNGTGLENWTVGDGFEVTGRVRLYYNARGEIEVQPASCDIDRDEMCSTSDIDLLVGAVVAESDDQRFDLTGDGQVNAEDLANWREIAAREKGMSDPYLLGDANLDGAVNATDLNSLALGWGESPNTWSGGDFLAVGKVNAANLNALAVNWRNSVPMAAQAVPEPSGQASFLLALVLLWLTRYRPTAVDSTVAEFLGNRSI